MIHQCQNCNHEVIPNQQGRCPDCGSEAITLVDKPFAHGSRENDVVIRESKRITETANRLKKEKP